MSRDCLTERSEPLIAAVSRERHQMLADRVQEISREMNARDILYSSNYVNAVARACAAELHEVASHAWTLLQKAHASCGQGETEKVLPYFLLVLEAESKKLDAKLEATTETVAAGLQNKSMLHLQAVHEAHDHLTQKYSGEIAIYTADLSRAAARTRLDRWKSRAKNNPLVAFFVIVAAGIMAITAVVFALEKWSSFVRGLLLGDG